MTDTEQQTISTDLLGLAAYAAITAQARLAKDADQAPKAFEHVAMARMSGAAWRSFDTLEQQATDRQIDIVQLVAQYDGLLDDFDARTRPTTWWERLTKTYVAVGIFTDALRELANATGATKMAEHITDFGHGEWVRERLEPYTDADEQLRARLSLWTRRVGGEALGLVRASIFTHEQLAAEVELDEVMETLTAAHHQRLKDIHLTA